MAEKSPLGLIPRQIWEEPPMGTTAERIQAIQAAIGRYTKAGKAIPPEWTAELEEISSTTRQA